MPIIRAGLPASGFYTVAHALGMSGEILAGKLNVPVRTLRHQKKKDALLSPANTEKLVRVARIQQLARSVFSTDQAVAQWLNTPAPALEGLAPIDLVDTDIGGREVEAVLQGIAYGNVM